MRPKSALVLRWFRANAVHQSRGSPRQLLRNAPHHTQYHQPPQFRYRVSEAAKDIIRTVNSSCRLGNISGGAAKVKAHPFFAGIDWAAVYQKRHHGPIIPPIKYSWDTQCFEDYPEEDTDTEEEYTNEMVTEYDQHFEAF
jgi:hypothetical protein